MAAGSERGAAWLAHQSGGLGVASSNLAAPTKNPARSKIRRQGQNEATILAPANTGADTFTDRHQIHDRRGR